MLCFKRILVLTALMPMASSWAIYGEYLDEKDLIPQSCQVVFDTVTVTETPLNAAKKPIGTPIVRTLHDQEFCSATLIGPNELVSAAHCSWITFAKVQQGIRPEKNGLFTRVRIENGEKVKAICRGIVGASETRDLDWQNSWFHPYYSDREIPMLGIWKDEPGYHMNFGPYFDVAIFKAAQAFTIPPLKYAKSSAEIERLRKLSESNPDRCHVYGYGLNNRGDRQTGTLHGMRAYIIQNQWNNLVSISSVNSVASGDSGGTFTCRDEQGEEILVGITSMTNVTKGPLQFYFEPSRIVDESIFTSVGYGPVQRWIKHVMAIPLDHRHSGHAWNPKDDHTKVNPFLTYEVPFLIEKDFPALIQDLQDCVNLPEKWDEVSRKQMAGYSAALKDAISSYQCAKMQYDDWRLGSKAIRGCQVQVMLNPDYEQELALQEGLYALRWIAKWTDDRSNFHLSYVKNALDAGKKILHTELRSCFIKGYAYNGEQRRQFPNAREVLLDWWMKH